MRLTSCLSVLFASCCCIEVAAQPVNGQRRFEYTEVHMAMPVRIVLHAADDTRARAAARAAFTRIAELENDLSDYRSTSDLRRIEVGAGKWITVKPTTFAVLARALDIARLSDGAFDPTAGPLVRLWRTARQTKRLPTPESVQSIKPLVSYKLVQLDSSKSAVRLSRRGMKLDLGGIAKGYILDQAMLVLRNRTPAAMIEAGGDILTGLKPPESDGWRIQVPGADSSFVRRAAALQHTALATSGASAQFVEINGLRYSHVIDPRTGRALTNGVTAHVIARDAATADAVATALTVLPPNARASFAAKVPSVIAYSVH